MGIAGSWADIQKRVLELASTGTAEPTPDCFRQVTRDGAAKVVAGRQVAMAANAYISHEVHQRPWTGFQLFQTGQYARWVSRRLLTKLLPCQPGPPGMQTDEASSVPTVSAFRDGDARLRTRPRADGGAQHTVAGLWGAYLTIAMHWR
jgi:hypothetical protein